MHCGYPQPLWWNGYHHNNYHLWDQVILELLRGDCLDRSFEISLREFIDSLYNHDTQRFSNGIGIYEELLNESTEKRRLIFNRLLHETISQNQANKELWDLLIENCSKDELGIYFSKIVEVIEGVQYHHTSYDDLYDIFDSSIIEKEIYPRSENDNNLLRVCNIYYEFIEIKNRLKIEVDEDDCKVSVGFCALIQTAYETNPPRLSLTNSIVLNLMKRLGTVNEDVKRLIEANRERLLDVGSKINNEFDDHYELDNWIE